MDSPRVTPPLHHGIDRHLPHGQPPPDPTPVASHIHRRRLVADEKRRWDVDGKLVFELMFWCAHEKFEFSPPHLPSTANHPTPTSHLIRSPYTLEYIVDEGKTKYQGEKWSASSSGWKLFDWLTLLFVHFCHTRWHILLNASRTQPTPLPTHRSPRIHQRRGVDEIWRRDVEEKEQIEEVRARVKDLSSLFSISPPLVDCCCCENKHHATINRPKSQTNKNKNKHTTINPRTILCLRQEGLVSCFSSVC
jgi:hypothetical protein